MNGLYYFQLETTKLIVDQIKITGSDTGGMKITQECMNFMAENNIVAETKLISSFNELHKAEEELIKGSSNEFRYILDIEKILS